MGYDSKHIQILNPKEGYNLIADEYANYHNHLNSFEKWFFLNLLPRNTDNLDVIDLWAWDGRIYKLLKSRNINFHSYTAFDLSEKLLSKHPGNLTTSQPHNFLTPIKVIWDLEQPLPFNDNSFNLAFSFFVLEHISNIDQLFAEVERILRPWWQWIIWHFLQRREFIRKKNHTQFKIQFFNHRIADLEKIAKKNLLSTHTIPIIEKGVLLWHILICTKS